jgi:hypothetical protein
MKKFIMISAMLTAFGIAYAQDDTTTATPDTSTDTTMPSTSTAPHVKRHVSSKPHPCASIEQACKNGKYLDDMHKTTHMGLHKDCVNPFLKSGAAPSGVDMSGITTDQVNACKTHMAAHTHHKKTTTTTPPTT